MELLVLQLAVLLIDLLQKSLNVGFQLEHFIVAEHESVQVGHLELAAIERQLSTLSHALPDHHLLDLLESGLPRAH